MAKKASPVAVKVLRSNGSGTMADVVRGVDWATEQHTKESILAKKTGKKYKGSVANMSLGGGKSPSLDLAVNGVRVFDSFFFSFTLETSKYSCLFFV